MTLKIGDKAPAIHLPADDDREIDLNDFQGQKLVLYFYPKDDTPGCTTEACSFTENLSVFNRLNVAVVGVSKDSVAKHKKFKTKHKLTFPLLSDEHGDVCERYGVWGEKSMYGKKYMGIERTTFLIDEKGVIAHIWPKVKVNGHVAEILDVVNG